MKTQTGCQLVLDAVTAWPKREEDDRQIGIQPLAWSEAISVGQGRVAELRNRFGSFFLSKKLCPLSTMDGPPGMFDRGLRIVDAEVLP